MTISRAQMGSQLTGNKMKKPTKKMKSGGKLINFLSPAAALVNTIRSGEPQGLMNLSPLAHAMARGQKSAATPEETQAMPASGMTTMSRPNLPARGMKSGGKVRGDGMCQRGKTKGRMV